MNSKSLLKLTSMCLAMMAQAQTGDPAAEAKKPAKEKLKAPHHPTRLIVKFKENVDSGAQEQLHQKLDTKPRKQLKKLRQLEVREKGRKSLEETIDGYQASGLVEYAEPDYEVHADPTPNDPGFSQMWHLDNTGQSGGKPDADMDAPEGWDSRTISGAIVAVIDTGIRHTHEDLAANMWRNPDEIPGNGVDDDGNEYIDDVHGINAISGSGNPMDDEGHGTHVAGTIGAIGNNAKGVTGVAWTVKLMACKFLASDGGGYTSDAIACIDYARSKGARILNNSWSGGGYSRALFDAINRCRLSDTIFVAAAGNESSNNDVNPVYPAGYSIENVIAVAATTQNDSLATFSNFGSATVEVGAPGDQILSTYNASNASYAKLSGTSMAAPQVAGLLALLKAHFPEYTYDQLMTKLFQTAEPIPALAGVTRTGRRINVQRALGTLTRPANDAFADAATATGDSFRVTGTTKAATKEPGESAHAGNEGGGSVWWKWTAPASGPATANTAGSSFDTLLGIYTGSTLGGLNSVASSDNAPNVATSAADFSANAGTTYYFAIDGTGGASGDVVLSVSAPVSGEPNNAFANRAEMIGRSFSGFGENLTANKEAREPNHAGNAGGKSVWWTWTAPANGYFAVNTNGSSFDTLLAIYTGTSLDSLRKVGANDDVPTVDALHSRVRFYAVKGRAYQIAVDGYDGEMGHIIVSGRYP